jgi:hypothetical protein
VEPEKAAERIAWFAQAILTIEKFAEEDIPRSAAEDLLKMTFRWSPRRAVRLFQWFLDHHIVWHDEALRILLHTALDGAKPPVELLGACIGDILMPIATSADPDLLVKLIERTATYLDLDQALGISRYLLARIQVDALPSSRKGWRHGVAWALLKIGVHLQDIGLDEIDLLPDPDKESSSRILKLKDGSTLHTDAVIMRASSIDKLRLFYESEADNSLFDWEPVVAHVSRNLDRQAVLAIVDLFHGHRRSSQILASLSQRLAQLRDVDGAWALAEQALNASNVFGWGRWDDGGTRLAAMKAVVGADPNRARPLVYEMLIQDLRGQWYPQNLALDLIDILPLLADHIPTQEIWEETERYVHVLFEGAPLSVAGPSDLTNLPLQDSSERALADLIVLHLKHPIRLLAHGAQRICIDQWLGGNPIAEDIVRDLLDADEESQERILPIVHAVGLRSVAAILPFRNWLVRLFASSNYTIRMAAISIAALVGDERSPDTRLIRSLNHPPILELPPASDDLDALIRFCDLYFETLAEESGLPAVKIRQRVIQLMRQLAPEETWSAQGENRLQAALSSARLLFQYCRPCSALARRAVSHMVAELAEAGTLRLAGLRRLESVLRFYDPVMLLTRPGSRPPEVRPISGRDEYGRTNGDWPSHVSEAINSVKFSASRGNRILAEETTLKRPEWENPTEVRRSVISLPTTPYIHPNDRYYPFSLQVSNSLVREYERLQADGHSPWLIIYNIAYGICSPGGNWLALNPAVGYLFGWELAEDSLFRWINDKGETMVESIWWRDGCIEQSPPDYDHEVGEGWLVEASEAALGVIISRLGTLKRLTSVRRSIDQSNQRLEKIASSEQILSWSSP